MENLFFAAQTQSMGILVLAEFRRFESIDFVLFFGQQKDPLYIRWHDSTAHQEQGFKVVYSQCDVVVKGERIDVHLFAFPPSLPANFNLRDLKFPVDIDGCLLIANRHFGYEALNRVVDGPRKRSKRIIASWLAWIQTQKTTFLVGTTGEESPALTIDQVRDYLDLGPEVPVLEIPSQFTVEQAYVYDLDEAKRVLATLVENIMINKP